VNKVYFRSYLLLNIVASSAYISLLIRTSRSIAEKFHYYFFLCVWQGCQVKKIKKAKFGHKQFQTRPNPQNKKGQIFFKNVLKLKYSKLKFLNILKFLFLFFWVFSRNKVVQTHFKVSFGKIWAKLTMFYVILI